MGRKLAGEWRVDAVDQENKELLEQGGVVADLMLLAEKVRSAAKEVARGVEHVALGLDNDRRGPLSVLSRRDGVGIFKSIQALLAKSHTPNRRDSIVMVGTMLDEARRHMGAGSAPVPWVVEAGRELAKSLGASVQPSAAKPVAAKPASRRKARRAR